MTGTDRQPDPAAWNAEQQRWADAPAMLVDALRRLSDSHPAIAPAALAEFERLVRRAINLDNPTREADYRELIAALAALPQPQLVSLGSTWIATDCVFLHLAVADAASVVEAPSPSFGRQILDWGIDYPDPSLNRAFVDGALHCLGRDAVIDVLADRLRGVGAVYYWVAARDQPVSAAERQLRRQLGDSAKFLWPWWRLW